MAYLSIRQLIRCACLFGSLFLWGSHTYGQTTCYVSTTGLQSASLAVSWGSSTTDLQGAINYVYSRGGGEVWVASGVYKPGGNANTDPAIRFSLRKGVAVYGGFRGNETMLTERTPVNPVVGQLSGTILSGDIGQPGVQTDNSKQIIYNTPDLLLDGSAILDGFVISDANGDGFGGGVLNDGGGDLNPQSGIICNPTYRNCAFLNNAATEGGAMNNRAPNAGIVSPTLINCLFQGNRATRGGAIYNLTSYTGGRVNPVVVNCAFINNTSTGLGGTIYNAVSDNATCEIKLINCTLTGNGNRTIWGSASSGGIQSLVCVNTIFWKNGTAGLNFLATFMHCLFDNDFPVAINEIGPGSLKTSVSPFVSATSIALNGCSAAINAGTTSVTTAVSGPYSETLIPATDLSGNPRIAGGRIDIGAVEYQDTPQLPLAFNPASLTGLTVCRGSSFSLPVSLTGTVIDAQWYRNQTPAGSTTALTITNAQSGDSGDYALVVSNACNSVTSTAVNVSVNALPEVTIAGFTADESGCPVRLSGSGTGTRFVIEGPGGYVFSHVYRQQRPHTAAGTALSDAGVYRFSVFSDEVCGSAEPVSRTVTVSKKCP